MGVEELCIRKIESGIRALKFKTKKPSYTDYEIKLPIIYLKIIKIFDERKI